MPLFRTLSLAALAIAALANGQEAPRLELQLDRERYIEARENNLYLRATVHTGGLQSDAERRPANFVFLVDRSGSMDGENLVALKAALRQALTQFSSQDHIAIVAFGSTVETLLPSTPADRLGSANAIVENILTEGGAALFDGLEAAAEEARKHADERSIDRIFLFADGLPNKGPRDLDSFAKLAQELASENIGITAFGIGSEYPEELLYRIVAPSGSSLRAASDTTQLSTLVSQELEAFSQTIAHNAVLEIQFESGIEVLESIGRPAEIKRRSAVFRFDKLLAFQEVSVIVQATLDPTKSYFAKSKVATARLTLQSPASSASPIELEASVETRFTPSEKHSFETIRPDVYQSVCEAEVSDAIREAIEAYQEGKDKRALRDLKRLARTIRSVASDIPELQVEASLDQLTFAIDSIENSEGSTIDKRAMMNTLYKSTRSQEPPSSE